MPTNYIHTYIHIVRPYIVKETIEYNLEMFVDVATLHAVTLQDRTITQAVRCISLLMRKFDPRPVPVGLLMDEMALRQGFSLYTYAFSCQYYSTNTPYSFLLSFIHSWMYCFVYSFIQPASHTFFFSFIHSSSQPAIHSSFRLFIHPASQPYILRLSSVLCRLINLQSQ